MSIKAVAVGLAMSTLSSVPTLAEAPTPMPAETHRTECPNRPTKFAVGPWISRLPRREQISHLRIHS